MERLLAILELACVVWMTVEVHVQGDECQCHPVNCIGSGSEQCYFKSDNCTVADCPAASPIYTNMTSNSFNCSKGDGFDPSMTCQECHESCEKGECEGEVSNCTKCSSEYKKEVDGDSLKCELDCYSGRFHDINNECLSCGSVLHNCSDCTPDTSLPMAEGFWEECNRSCNGMVTAPTSNMSLTCDSCDKGYYLYKLEMTELCTCCLKDCPDNTQGQDGVCLAVATIKPKESFCQKHNIWCLKIIPAIAGGLAFLILLVILVCVTVKKCRGKSSKDIEGKKPMELPSKSYVDEVTRVQRNSYPTEDTKLHEHKRGVGAGNQGADIDPVIQEEYVNVPSQQHPGSQPDGQEIYENTEADVQKSVTPQLPPRRGRKDSDAKEDYVNEDVINEMAKIKPHFHPNKGKPQTEELVPPPPSGEGHKHGKAHGYANQETIDKFAGLQNEEEPPKSPEYQNVKYPPIKQKPDSLNLSKVKNKGADSGNNSRSNQTNGLSQTVLAQAVPAPAAQKGSRDYYNVPQGAYYNK